jgi:hypothetical protein
MADNPPFSPEISIRLIALTATSAHIPALLRGKTTHDPARDFICQLLHHTKDRDLLHAIIEAALPPDYSGNTLSEIDAMIDWATAHSTASASQSQSKPTATQAALEIPAVREIHLFHNPLKEPYATVRTAAGGPLTVGVGKEIFKLWMQGQYYAANGRPLTEKATQEIIEQLSARALFDGPEEIVHLRYADHDEAVWVDLGDETGAAIRIAKTGWSIEKDHNVRFRRGTGMLPLPEPVAGGDLEMLRALTGLEGTNWRRVVAFLVNCLKPGGPYFVLLAEGQQGSGKSVLGSTAKRIIDPHQLDRIRLPRNEHDLIIQAQESALLNFDNTSKVSDNLSDSLCALSTRTSFGTRKYYTDNEIRIMEACRPVMINGIGEYARRPDLVDRSIPLNLPSIDGPRRTEEELKAKLIEILPAILGVLYDAVSRALRIRDSVHFDTQIRMADAARWITAAEGELGFKPGELVAAVLEGQSVLLTDVAVNDPLYIVLMKIVEDGLYEGMMADLHDAIGLITDREKGLPKTAAHLSNALQRLKPAADGLGLHIDLIGRSQKGRQVRIWRDGQEHQERKSKWTRPN